MKMIKIMFSSTRRFKIWSCSQDSGDQITTIWQVVDIEVYIISKWSIIDSYLADTDVSLENLKYKIRLNLYVWFYNKSPFWRKADSDYK